MSTQEILDEVDKMLSTQLTEEERVLLEKMTASIKYYKSLIPKELKQDVVRLMQMAYKYKSEYDELKDILSSNL
jgi:hypothetical protein